MLKSLLDRYRQHSNIRHALRSGRLQLDEGVTWSRDFSVKFTGSSACQMRVGRNSHLAGRFVVRGDGGIAVGSHCHFHEDSYFGSLAGIDIGDSVFAAEGIFIVDNNNHPVSPRRRRAMTLTPMGGPEWSWTAEGVDSAKVRIGENVWLGRACSVLKGVDIGADSIIALAAVVTRSVPPGSIVAGNPGRVVKTIAEGEGG